MDVNVALVPSSLSVERLRDRLALSRLVPGLENSAVPDMSGGVIKVCKENFIFISIIIVEG